MYLQTVIFALAALVSSKDWQQAERYAASQRESWGEIWEAFGVETKLAEAVVFPELVRYSALRDVMETAATRAIYQQRGSGGADFSIGRFQMKPSWAERVEREWMAASESIEWGLWFDVADTPQARRARVRRLDDDLWQCTYLAIFLKQLQARHPELANEPPERRVKLCAAAYNGGAETIEEMERLADRSYFHTDFIPGPRTKYYCYGDIATYYYQLRITN